MTRDIYLVEVGVLKDDDNELMNFYSSVYDKKHAYFDEDQFYCTKESYAERKTEFLDYVKNGVNYTYMIVSETTIDDNDEDELPLVSDETYLPENVIFSVVKVDDKMVESFVETTPLTEAKS